MEQSRNIERRLVLLRWLVMVVAGLMLAGAVPWQKIAAGMAFVAAYNAALMLTAGLPRQAVWNGRLNALAWVFDVLVLSAAVGVSLRSVPSLYFLYVLIIMEAGYASPHLRKVGLTTLGSFVGNAAATFLALSGGDLGMLPRLLALHSAALLAAAAMAATVNVFKRREDALQRRDRKLSSLMELGTRFTSSKDVDRLMEQTLRVALNDTGATAGYIMLMDATTQELVTEVAFSTGDHYPFPEKRAAGEGVEGYVAQTGKPLLLSRQRDAGRSAGADLLPALQYDGEAALCVPLVESAPIGPSGGAAGGRMIGTFSIFNHRPGGRFLAEDMELVRTIAGLTTMAIVNAQLYQSQHDSFVGSLQVLARTLDAKDPYTQGHSYRVSELCVMIARKLRIAPEVIDELRNGALLHDIGKIGVPDAVLRKPERLTDEEFQLMKEHPLIGFEICQPLGLGEGILMLIRNHHEKLDGSGYPDGLKLGELPLLLRIICVADAFDAMSSSRPYRKSMDTHIRNEQLNRFAGTQFDPIIVETLKGLLRNGELDELYKDQWATPEEMPMVEKPLLRAV
jgi:putative nucleotidyltransferase with HDIG domain